MSQLTFELKLPLRSSHDEIARHAPEVASSVFVNTSVDFRSNVLLAFQVSSNVRYRSAWLSVVHRRLHVYEISGKFLFSWITGVDSIEVLSFSRRLLFCCPLQGSLLLRRIAKNENNRKDIKRQTGKCVGIGWESLWGRGRCDMKSRLELSASMYLGLVEFFFNSEAEKIFLGQKQETEVTWVCYR